MLDLLREIKGLSTAIKGKPATSEEIIKVQQDLKFNGFPAIPAGYADLLHNVNALEYNGCFLYGISPRNFMLDIFAENVHLNLREKEFILALGEDEFSLLCYDCRRESYPILDKESLQACRIFRNPASAVRYILKMEEALPLF